MSVYIPDNYITRVNITSTDAYISERDFEPDIKCDLESNYEPDSESDFEPDSESNSEPDSESNSKPDLEPVSKHDLVVRICHLGRIAPTFSEFC